MTSIPRISQRCGVTRIRIRLRRSLSNRPPMMQIWQIHADWELNLRQSAADLWQSEFHVSTLTWPRPGFQGWHGKGFCGIVTCVRPSSRWNALFYRADSSPLSPGAWLGSSGLRFTTIGGTAHRLHPWVVGNACSPTHLGSRCDWEHQPLVSWPVHRVARAISVPSPRRRRPDRSTPA